MPIIGITGTNCVGKTTFAKDFVKKWPKYKFLDFSEQKISLLSDGYKKDQMEDIFLNILVDTIKDSKEKNFDAFIRVYNSDDNRYGELISIMVSTQNFNEGLDLKAVRHIHIFEPLLTIASDLQSLGSARRYCSHAALDKAKGEWTVKVWRYMSVFGDMADMGPTKAKRVTKKTKDAKAAAADGFVADLPTMDKVKESIEELVERTAKEKYQQLFEITYAMREAAIDKGLALP